jgi:hypothetical protein
MNDAGLPDNELARAVEPLLQLALDRDEIKALLDQLPEGAAAQRPKVEYELQLLRIICVGWSIGYLLAASPRKQPLTEGFWEAVRSFSRNVSQVTGAMVGQEIDYFGTLKARFDTYLTAMRLRPDAPEPAAVLAPAFAELCGRAEDVFTVMIGARLVIASMSAVRAYLAALEAL